MVLLVVVAQPTAMRWGLVFVWNRRSADDDKLQASSFVVSMTFECLAESFQLMYDIRRTTRMKSV